MVTKIKRIGPRMRDAVTYVRMLQPCAILPIARRVGPHRSTKYGYAIVHRAIKAGLIKATCVKGRYTLTIDEP